MTATCLCPGHSPPRSQVLKRRAGVHAPVVIPKGPTGFSPRDAAPSRGPRLPGCSQGHAVLSTTVPRPQPSPPEAQVSTGFGKLTSPPLPESGIRARFPSEPPASNTSPWTSNPRKRPHGPDSIASVFSHKVRSDLLSGASPVLTVIIRCQVTGSSSKPQTYLRGPHPRALRCGASCQHLSSQAGSSTCCS